MRRRHQLKPDTFPFLAVLLCAMGSLILILLELDRRARSAAHGRAEAAWRQDEQEKAELLARLRARREAERQAEIERHRQGRESRLAAHQAEVEKLRGQEQGLHGERSQVEARINDLLRAMENERAAQSAGEKLREEETRTVEETRRLLMARKEQLEKTKRRAETSQSERTRLTRDLLAIEEALARLKEQKLRERKSWSVVPYVGKRGLNRMPLYVECDAYGLVFQPDRKRIGGSESNIDAVRAEVRRRSQEFAAKLPAGAANAEPYWLLLIRPDGILPYYTFVQAVKPLETAYGYEFIDPGWDLDFPNPSGQPAPAEIASPLPSPAPKKLASGPPPFRGGTPGITAGRAGIPGSGIPVAGPIERGPFPGNRGMGGQPFAGGAIGGREPGQPFMDGSPRAGSPGIGQDREGRPGGNEGAGGSREGGETSDGATGGGGPGQSLADGPPRAGSPGIGPGKEGTPGGNRGVNATQEGGRESGGPGATLLPPRQESPGLAPVGRGGQEGGQAGGQVGNAASAETPATPPGAIPSEGTSDSTGGGGESTGGGGEPSRGGSPPDAAGPDRITGRGVKANGADGSALPPLQPASRTGAPEWVLAVDCMPDRVRLSPSQLVVPLADLVQGRGGIELLQRTARDLVARRRAVQRPGSPPVRIVIRFLVQREGLRAFHLSYPLFDGIDAEKRAVLSGD